MRKIRKILENIESMLDVSRKTVLWIGKYGNAFIPKEYNTKYSLKISNLKNMFKLRSNSLNGYIH